MQGADHQEQRALLEGRKSHIQKILEAGFYMLAVLLSEVHKT